MDDALRTRIEEAAEVQALRNALEHGGTADPGAVMGAVMGESPAFREHADAVQTVLESVVEDVNRRPTDAQRDRLESLAPAVLADLEAEESGSGPTLPPLPDAEEGAVRLRCAPNPNGPWHIGHARMPAVIGRYRSRYDGWFCVRFDDTDPETKRPLLEAYDWILADCAYLGHEPDAVYRASDRLETYYRHARRLIEADGAYTCDLSAAAFSERKAAGEPSPNREKAPETSLSEFEGMIDGEYDPGELTLRVRTDLDHPNPAVRDWAAFRIVETPHPREAAADYRCWPLLDFQSAVDDHELSITHIIRGIDLQDSAKRQRYLYDRLGWTYPAVVHWGRVAVEGYDVPLSTSAIADRIDGGDLEGWDDPRAPTLQSLRRRGIEGEAVTRAMVELGTSSSEVTLPMSAIYAENRSLIDGRSDRRFLVRDGLELPLGGSPPSTARPPRHPTEDRGEREIPVGETVLIEAADRPAREERVWLKGLGCVRDTRDALVYTGEDIDVVREGDVDVVHWVPAEVGVPTTLETPDGPIAGHAEPGIREEDPGTVVQFERVGFARLDTLEGDGVLAYFAHP